MKTPLQWDPDWPSRSAMFAPLRTLANKIGLADWPGLERYAELLAEQPIVNSNGMPLSFIEPGPATPENRYEIRSFLKGEVQTRSRNWHDLFNALIWLAFPKSKSQINRMHYLEALQTNERSRTQAQNALTHFDESGAIVLASDARLAALLKDFAWKELFWENRRQVATDMEFLIFGHGLLEKALTPYVGMTGPAMVIQVERDLLAEVRGGNLAPLDRLLAGRIEQLRSPLELSPLPALGVPGWASENEQQSFYDNERYFRRGRMRNLSAANR